MGKRKKRRYPPVWVTWTDSTFHKANSVWMSRDEVMEWAPGPLPHCQTAGFLVHQDRHGVTVALSISEFGNVADFIKIPRECIRILRYLKRGKTVAPNLKTSRKKRRS